MRPLKVGHKTNDREEVGPHLRGLADLLVDLVGELGRQDLHQGGECQLPHGVLLDWASGQVSVGGESEMVYCLDKLGDILLSNINNVTEC